MTIEPTYPDELDYFECLQLSDHKARLHVSPESSWIESEVMRLVLKNENMRGVEVTAMQAKKMTPEILKEIEQPMPTHLDMRGKFKLINMEDKYWILAFIAPPEFVYILKGGSFENTLDNLK
ncbi:hypothetical protein GTB64_004525 [Salmonella enterica]|nr:hypothetical protein [Salmonella enterica]